MKEGTGRHTLVALLKACAKQKNLRRGSKIHADIINTGLLEKDAFAGSALISMYAKCGLLAKAQEVLSNLPVRDVVSWNVLIVGYSQQRLAEEALKCFERMQLDDVSPNTVTFACILKACGDIGATKKGQEIHAELVTEGLLENDIILGTALVDMYVKFGLLAKAQEVFDKLKVRDVVSYCVLIAGFVQQGYCKEALNCFDLMQSEGISPDAVAYICVLKACGSIGAAVKGQEIRAEIMRHRSLEKDIVVGTALLDMYVKCGLFAQAQEVFEKLPGRDVVLWNAFIAGYAQHGHGQEALNCYEQMQLEGFSANAVTFVSILKACGSIGTTDKGQEVHAAIAREGLLEKDIFVGNALVDMYAKCNLLANAQEVCDKLLLRDAITWSTLIGGYVQQGHHEKALNCFGRMQFEGISPEVVTFVCILKACGSIGAIDKGQEIHTEVVREGLLEKHIVVGNALVDMYAKCGLLAKAQEVFDNLPALDVGLWNTLISGYTQHGQGDAALDCFARMQLGGFFPNAATFVSILEACGSVGAAHKGQEVHADIDREGLLEKDVLVGNALVDMYAKCGLLSKAQCVFDKISHRDVVLWSALIAGYAQHGYGEEAVNCYERMQLEGFSPNVVTFTCILKACGSIGGIDKGQEIHAEVLREGLFESYIVVGNALVDMYAKCGFLAKAEKVFDSLPVRDIVTWNVLLAGYAQHGHNEEALGCFEQIQLVGLTPNIVSYVYILKACGNLGASNKGQEIHADIVKNGLFEKHVVVGNALIDMYAKSGLVAKAVEVFETLPVRNVVSWNALITGYALLGKAENVFHAVDKMLEEGVEPDFVTFTSVLNVCSHTGLLEKGQMYFEIMRTACGIIPSSEHYTCMVDLLARAGHLDLVARVVKEMPFAASPSIWHSLLGACRKWGNLDLGRLAFEHAVQLDDKDHSAYICMSSLYLGAGRPKDVDEIEDMRKQALDSKSILLG